jgi:hypothetical protein
MARWGATFDPDELARLETLRAGLDASATSSPAAG